MTQQQLELPGVEEKREPGYVVMERRGHKLCIAPGSVPEWLKKGWRIAGRVQ